MVLLIPSGWTGMAAGRVLVLSRVTSELSRTVPTAIPWQGGESQSSRTLGSTDGPTRHRPRLSHGKFLPQSPSSLISNRMEALGPSVFLSGKLRGAKI